MFYEQTPYSPLRQPAENFTKKWSSMSIEELYKEKELIQMKMDILGYKNNSNQIKKLLEVIHLLDDHILKRSK
mgnify:CR=1 FL=1